MASKPIIKPITPFDADKGTTIYAQYSGSLPFHNRVVIYDASNLVVVYSRTIKETEYKHFVDPSYKGSAVKEGDRAYALENGKRYLATIQFFGKDVETEQGLVSDKQSFLTRSTAQFYFQNLQANANNVIYSSTIDLTLVYSQAEFDKLLNFKFEIYDSSKVLLQETPVIYNTNNLSYSFKGLENMSTYYVRAEGTTASGVHLDTGYVKILTQYENPAIYARMLVSNNPKTSEMNYRTNFIIAEADEGEDFQFENGWIHLENGESCTYSAGFLVEDDATFFVRVRQVNFNTPIFQCWGDRFNFYLEVLHESDDKSIVRLVVPNEAGYNYMLYSEPLDVDWIVNAVNIWVRKIGNVYLLKAMVQTDAVVFGKMYVGLLSPLDDPICSGSIEENDAWIENMPILGIRLVPEEDIYYQEEEPLDANRYSIWVSCSPTIEDDDTAVSPEEGNSEGDTDPIDLNYDPNDPHSEQGNTEGGQIGDNGEPDPEEGGDSVEV